MRYERIPKTLVEETKKLISLALFLRHEVGLQEDLSVYELKQILLLLESHPMP